MLKEYTPKTKTTDTYIQTRYNAVQHGALSRLSVLPWENAKELEEIQQAFIEDHQPKGATEKYLILELANIVFRKARLYQAENSLVCKNLHHLGNSSTSYHAKAAKFLSEEDCRCEGYENNDTLEKAFYHDSTSDQDDIDYYKEKIQFAQNLIDSDLSYEKMLEKLSAYLVELWQSYDYQYELNRDGLILFLEEKIIKYGKNKIASIKARPYVKQHAIACSYIPDEKTETLQRYETTLDRRFERTLATLLKLQEMRKNQTSLITQEG